MGIIIQLGTGRPHIVEDLPELQLRVPDLWRQLLEELRMLIVHSQLSRYAKKDPIEIYTLFELFWLERKVRGP
jgi:hypothetical protein